MNKESRTNARLSWISTALEDLILLEEVEHGLGGLGPLLQPDLGFLHVDAHSFTGAGDGIHEP
jgi:hypothetical protein